MRVIGVALGLFTTLALARGEADFSSEREAAAREMQRGNYALAYCVWAKLGNAGDPDALYNLGWMFHNGYGLAVDDAKAQRMWQQAAEAGHAGALFALGDLYRQGGRGVKADRRKAVAHYLRAIDGGMRDAGALVRLMLGQMGREDAEFRSRILRDRGDSLGGGLTVRGRTNFRAGASLGSRIIRVLDGGEPFIELLREGGWIHVASASGEEFGWLHASVVQPR